MKAFLAALVVGVLVAVAAQQLLQREYQTASYQAYTTEGVRLGDPGQNLVGF